MILRKQLMLLGIVLCAALVASVVAVQYLSDSEPPNADQDAAETPIQVVLSTAKYRRTDGDTADVTLSYLEGGSVRVRGQAQWISSSGEEGSVNQGEFTATSTLIDNDVTITSNDAEYGSLSDECVISLHLLEEGTKMDVEDPECASSWGHNVMFEGSYVRE